MTGVYLDHNATTFPLPDVVQAVTHALQHDWANPSSVHRAGQNARQHLELARRHIAQLVGCTPAELIFTSGGTEANNLALRGLLEPAALRKQPAHLISTPLEHAAIREPAQTLKLRGIDVAMIQTDTQGRLDLDTLIDAARQRMTPHATVLISVQWVNNETGVIQPIPEIAQRIAALRSEIAEQNIRATMLLHTDATQAVGKMPIDMHAAGVDLMTFASHKFHGPKGVGCLAVRRGVRLQPTQPGGPQETDRRGGTENTPAIIGMGVAAQAASTFLSDPSALDALTQRRDTFEQQVKQCMQDVVINAVDAPRLWTTSNLAFPPLHSEALLLGLSERNVYVSAGAACSSGSLEPSPVLLAMGIPEPVAHGSLRFSFSRFTTDAELSQALDALSHIVERLRQTLPVTKAQG